MTSGYVELHARSAFSFLEGACLPEELAGACAAFGMPAMAIMDRNGVYGAPRFHIAAKQVGEGVAFRLGGLVEMGSVKHGSGAEVHFRVTDGKSSVPANFNGVLPALFREGQGVVATGSMNGNGTFVAKEVLAKHDEKYMPPEVVDALKRSGRWQEGNP